MADVATMDIACRGARDFVRIYFKALDSDERSNFLPVLHRPTSSTLWNGTPLSADMLAAYLAKLPLSRHEVQTIDVHPVLGVSPAPMQVLVTGSVIYYQPSSDPSLPVEKQRLPPMGPTELKKYKERADVERLPRAFHASFVLVPDEAAEGVKYYIGSSLYRFVG